MEHIEHEGDLPTPEQFVAAAAYPFGPVGDNEKLFGVVQAAAQRFAVKAHGEIGGIPASRRHRRSVDEATERLAACVLQCRAGLRIPPLGGVDDRQLGFAGLRAPSSCFPAMPLTSSFRIGIPVPSMDKYMRDSRGLPSTTSSRSKRRASSPSARGPSLQ